MSKKVLCIYHKIDLDGWMSAAIVKYWFEKSLIITNPDIDSITDKIDFIGYNYGQPIPDLSEYNQIIMCDISFSKEEMLKLYERLNSNFIWIDHHISAIKDIYGEHKWLPTDNDIKGIIDVKFAACELTWQYFFPNKPMPEIVRLLGLYDSFRHKNTDEEQKVLEFQYGARQVIQDYETAYNWLEATEGFSERVVNETLEEIFNKGKAIYQYLCTEAKQVYKNGFSINFIYTKPDRETADYIHFLCINKERFNPINFGIDYHKDGYDGVASFCYDGVAKVWRFSLYNDNGLVDCSVIAKQFGGGGNKGAAGFVVKNLNEIF